MQPNTRFRPRPLFLTVASMACATGAASLTGLLMKPPAQVLPFVIWLPIVAACLAVVRSAAVRNYVLSIPMPLMVAVQVIRAPVGAWFLVQGARGVLPASLASLAGFGDVAFGLASAALLLAWRFAATSPRALALWNTIGLVEILAVNVSAMRLVLFSDAGPHLRNVMTSFPVVWIPLVLVPCVICAHLLAFARLRPHLSRRS